ncbi:MAG: DUF2442 domain-containing protein [Lachnospiraceae bacterium]|nr:DUF2442 domain-containing protein [Lachnospiraceae bacterium]
MTHRIKFVKALDNLKLSVVFQSGTEKEYNVRGLYPVFPQFEEFETSPELFRQVKVDAGGYGISWNDELDLDAEEIWECGITVGKKEVGLADMVAEQLISARGSIGMTQCRLAEETGIYQADISKIERGLANPSLVTLQRLADGMDMEVRIEFVPKRKV